MLMSLGSVTLTDSSENQREDEFRISVVYEVYSLQSVHDELKDKSEVGVIVDKIRIDEKGKNHCSFCDVKQMC